MSRDFVVVTIENAEPGCIRVKDTRTDSFFDTKVWFVDGEFDDLRTTCSCSSSPKDDRALCAHVQVAVRDIVKGRKLKKHRELRTKYYAWFNRYCIGRKNRQKEICTHDVEAKQ